MMSSIRVAIFGALALTTGMPSQAVAAVDGGNPDNLCQVSIWQREAVALVCKPGEKVVFLPKTFGNEQLPVYFAAVNCDLRYPVVWTTGGVTCIWLFIINGGRPVFIKLVLRRTRFNGSNTDVPRKFYPRIDWRCGRARATPARYSCLGPAWTAPTLPVLPA